MQALFTNKLINNIDLPVSRPKHFVQPKLTINTPGDRYEQEADAMADSVMRMSSNELIKPVTGLIGKSLQRKCGHCEEEEKKKKPIIRKAEAGNSGMPVSSSFAASLHASKGGGSPLPQETRSFMENSFSTDFSSVKIHTDGQASEMSKDINAKAFTTGNDIYFKSGEYSPNSWEGKKLLAHELTHVLQQENGRAVKIHRFGDLSKVPPMACDVASSSSGGTLALSSLFPTSSTSLSATQASEIATFVLSWQASGGTDILRVDGYASTPGADEMNWQLSCDRALSVANELRNNGVPDAMIEIFVQGETREFGAPGNNQRANISIMSPITPPALVPVPSSDCRVDVRATQISGLYGLPIYHLFVVIVRNNTRRSEIYFRGGPTPGGPGDGNIITEFDLYLPETIDWAPSAPTVTAQDHLDCRTLFICLTSELSRIDGTATPYSPTGPNSNTVARTILHNCNIPEVKPVDIAPGWNDPYL